MAGSPDVPRRRIRWRILRDEPGSGPWNMAVDLALARCLRPDEGVLRIYRWSRPTLSFGRNQPIRNRYDPWAAEQLGVEVVRRPTGGREVLHDRELTYAVMAPLEKLGGLRNAYRTLNEALVAALHSLGVAARTLAEDLPTPELEADSCFDAPAGGEIAVEERKLVGSAQLRIDEALLQHGSLLLEPGAVTLDALRLPPSVEDVDVRSSAGFQSPDGTPHSPPITLTEILGSPPSFPTVAAAVEAAMAGSLGGRWNRGELRDEEGEVARELLAQYASSEWTWRR